MENWQRKHPKNSPEYLIPLQEIKEELNKKSPHKQFQSDEEAKASGLKIGDICQVGHAYTCNDHLAILLTHLRDNQKRFFKSPQGSLPRQEALKESKRLEKELDEFLKRRKSDAQKAIELF